MTLKHRLDRLERTNLPCYDDLSEIPTRVLDAMLMKAYRDGEWPKTREEEALFKSLVDLGFSFSPAKTNHRTNRRA